MLFKIITVMIKKFYMLCLNFFLNPTLLNMVNNYIFEDYM